eukprot:scaffold36842_cov28-Tisochrysis_lutea.AAC.5
MTRPISYTAGEKDVQGHRPVVTDAKGETRVSFLPTLTGCDTPCFYNALMAWQQRNGTLLPQSESIKSASRRGGKADGKW